MKNSVVTTANGTVYEVDVSGAEVDAVVELLGVTMAMFLTPTYDQDWSGVAPDHSIASPSAVEGKNVFASKGIA
jgi:hypothetical protein